MIQTKFWAFCCAIQAKIIAINLGRICRVKIAISNLSLLKNAHKNVPQSLLKSESIKSKANCNTCYKDAEMGLLGKSNIDFAKIHTLQKSDYSGKS